MLRGYTVQEISGGTVRWTDTYSYEYSLQDGYLETKVTGTSSQQNRRASETLSSYDGWGRRTSLEERTNLRDFKQTLRSARYFAYDAEGGLISRREGELVEVQGQTLLQFRQARKEDDKFKNFNPVPHLIEQAAWNAMSAGEREYWAGAANTHRYSFANGQLLGSVNEAGRMSVGDRLTGFANSSLGTSTAVVRSGETLRSVAQRIYGDGSLWYVLADANGLTNSDETLAEGQNLQVPQVGTNTNSASTFKPYDPSEQIGPTAPSLPTIAPPPKNSCNPVAQLLMVVVSVALSVVTYGLINPATTLGAIGAGAAAGAAGALGGQVVGSVTGVSSFSWRNVAAGAVTGAITAGIAQGIGPVNGEIASVGRLLDAGRPLAAAVMALGNAAAGYIGNKVAGVQGTSFSWRNIAGSAVGSMISSAAFNKLEWNQPGAFEKSGSFGQSLVTGFVGGLVSAHTQKAFGADVNVNEGRMALDAFGNAIGNSVGSGMLKSFHASADRRNRAAFGDSESLVGAYDHLRSEGISPTQARRVLGDPALRRTLATRDALNAQAMSIYGASFDALAPEQQEQLLMQRRNSSFAVDREAISNSILGQGYGMGGTLEIDIVGGRGTTPRSTLHSFGVRASGVILEAQQGLGSAIETLGEGNVRAAVMATQFALGGIPRTLIDLAISNSPVGQFVAENMQTYLRGPLSSAYAEGVFGATGSEVDAVRPASDLTADFTIGLAGTALPFVGKAGVDMLVNAATRTAGVFRSAKARLEAKVREQYTLLRGSVKRTV